MKRRLNKTTRALVHFFKDNILPRKASTYNYEKSLAELEAVVEKLETGDISLEDSLKQFEQGIKLTRSCQKALQNAEQKVQTLLNDDEHTKLSNVDNDKT